MEAPEFDLQKVLEGAEIIETLDELNDAYDAFLQLNYHGSEEEIAQHKSYIEEKVSELASGSEETANDNFIETLDDAFGASIMFENASKEERLEVRECCGEKYRRLVKSCPSKHSLEPRLLKRYAPNKGELYNLTRLVINEDAGSLERWVEHIEETQESLTPATEPDDRSDSADRMYR